MNRYLIVVFCVLTGCASAVPLANSQELVLDNQQFVAWCAEHIQNVEDSYAAPILVEVKTEKVAEIYCVNTNSKLLLKNLPEFPVLKKVATVLYCLPESEPIRYNYTTKINAVVALQGNNPIRAPGALA